jgi:diguanylate cyclase
MFIKNSISTKLLKKVFLIYFAITFIMTALQIMIEYYDTKSTIQKNLISLEDIYMDSLKNAVWDMNIDQVENLTDSISKLSFVKEVTLLDASGNIMSHKKAPNLSNRFSHEFNIYQEFNNKKILIAKAIFCSDQNSVIDIVKTGIILIILNAMIKSTILLFLFIWAFQKNLIEPLNDLTNQIDNIKLDTLGTYKIEVDVPINSELYMLQKKFNQMSEKLAQQKNTILIMKQDYTQKLEKEVRERTLELEQLNIGLNHMATTDYLTNIRNRRSFFDVGDQYFVMAKRNDKELCVLAFDIDNFKNINDTYGHQAGDEVLKQFAANCKQYLRESDVLGRMGGEEFTALLFETSLEESIRLAERIVKHISDIGIPIENETIFYTVSVGVASLLSSDTKLDEILARADRALYKAKANGRNQVAFL